MSLSRRMRREVTIVRRVVTGRDARGNEIIGDGDRYEGLRALRDRIRSEEDDDQRDTQERVYRYLIEARHPLTGEPLEISGYDRLEDALETFEIRGEPEPAEQQARPRIHHLELVAAKIGRAPSSEDEGS